MTTYLEKSCSFGLLRVPFVNCRQFMFLVISLLVLRAGCGIWLYQFLIIAYHFTFCWDQNVDAKALSVPAPGLYTREKKKNIKNMYKIRVQSCSFFFFSQLATNDQNDKAFLLTLKFWPGVCLPLPGAIYMKEKRVEIVLKRATNGQSDKSFLLTSTFVSKGLSAPALAGAIYMYKRIIIYTRTRCQVSVYRTTCPLVVNCEQNVVKFAGKWGKCMKNVISI